MLHTLETSLEVDDCYTCWGPNLRLQKNGELFDYHKTSRNISDQERGMGINELIISPLAFSAPLQHSLPINLMQLMLEKTTGTSIKH